MPKWPLPHLALKTWKVWGLKDTQKTKFCKAIILLLKNNERLKKKNSPTKNSKGGACILSQPLPDSTCAYEKTKMLVFPPHITDENRDTERLSILTQLTQLLRAGLRTGPLWSNLESRCCDDPEGAAETRWPMLSLAHTHTHTCMWPSPLRLQKSEETRGQPGEAKGESRSIRRRSHTYQEARESLSPVSLSQTLDSSPWTQELTVQ